jgi:hypothetical protein
MQSVRTLSIVTGSVYQHHGGGKRRPGKLKTSPKRAHPLKGSFVASLGFVCLSGSWRKESRPVKT